MKVFLPGRKFARDGRIKSVARTPAGFLELRVEILDKHGIREAGKEVVMFLEPRETRMIDAPGPGKA